MTRNRTEDATQETAAKQRQQAGGGRIDEKAIQFVTDERCKDRITKAYSTLTTCEIELRQATARHADADRQLCYLIERYHKRDLISLNREAIMEYITAPEYKQDD